LFQLLLSQCSWKEYRSESGKTYYHNVNTKESRWTVPKELEELKARIAAEDVVVSAATVAGNRLDHNTVCMEKRVYKHTQFNYFHIEFISKVKYYYR